jgi:hypothetical protein
MKQIVVCALGMVLAAVAGCSAEARSGETESASGADTSRTTVQNLDGRQETFWVDNNCVWHQWTAAGAMMQQTAKIGDCFGMGFARIRKIVRSSDGRLEVLVQYDPRDSGMNNLFVASQVDPNGTMGFGAWTNIVDGTSNGVDALELPGGRLDVFYIVPGNPDGTFAHRARPMATGPWNDAESLGRVPAGLVELRPLHSNVYKDNDVITSAVLDGVIDLSANYGIRYFAQYDPNANYPWTFQTGSAAWR